MTANRVGAYFISLFFIGIPITIVLWLVGIWSDNAVQEQNFYQTAGLATTLTLGFGMIGTFLASE